MEGEELKLLLITDQNADRTSPDQSTSDDNLAMIKKDQNYETKTAKKRRILKMLRNTGQAYLSSKSCLIRKRQMKEPCTDKCRHKCETKFTEEERKTLFKSFWDLGDVEKQWKYISECSTPIRPKYRYIREGATKTRQYKSSFHFKLLNKEVRVCKIFFKNTLGISDRPIRTVLEKRGKGLLVQDNRGKHNRRR